MTMTGRITAAPSRVWHEEVLAPQFAHEVEHLLRHYVAIEKVLLLEYVRMGVADAADAAAVARRLNLLRGGDLLADPAANMSDISFAIERFVGAGPAPPFAAWHVDRSRNDLQACAQLMAVRERLFAVADDLAALGRAALRAARTAADLPMPGFTHAQAAQIVSPGFYLTALAEETLATAQRLASTWEDCFACPLGAGSMAGQELPWDRTLMAHRLGFAKAVPHALTAVASRRWALAVASDLAGYAVTLSRFVTDLMAWGGSEYGFLDLPDELSGISAAMPQKRNFPVLERIRGRCSQVAGAMFDLASGQRNTAYTNTVEVSKEAGSRLWAEIDALRSSLRLATTVLENLGFHAERMRESCEREYLGGFSLANLLTLECGLPWRTAQIVAGRAIKRAVEAGVPSSEIEPGFLVEAAAEEGHRVPDAARLLAAAFSVDAGLRAKRSSGSTHPDAVLAMAAEQEAGFEAVEERWRRLRTGVEAAIAQIDVHFEEQEPRHAP
ncbi:lyase family protein [Catenulispora subtropica]|uniref:argininosuccinate lyase n=1 Tax=Catenulispora subtropica TaxID=450798 RepID=A0ABN2TAB9_9ACTN